MPTELLDPLGLDSPAAATPKPDPLGIERSAAPATTAPKPDPLGLEKTASPRLDPLGLDKSAETPAAPSRPAFEAAYAAQQKINQANPPTDNIDPAEPRAQASVAGQNTPVRAAIQSAKTALAAPVSFFSPQTGELIRHEQAVDNPVAPTAINKVAGFVGGVAPTVATIATAPEALALPLFGAQGAIGGAGAARSEALQQREAGHDVSGGQEAAAAAGYGVIGAAANIGAGKVFGAGIGSNAIQRIGASAAINSGISAASQVGENVIAGQTIDPDRSAVANVPQAAGEGAAQGLLLGGLGEIGRAIAPKIDPLGIDQSKPDPLGLDKPQPQTPPAAGESTTNIAENITKPAAPPPGFELEQAQAEPAKNIPQTGQPIPKTPESIPQTGENIPPAPEAQTPSPQPSLIADHAAIAKLLDQANFTDPSEVRNPNSTQSPAPAAEPANVPALPGNVQERVPGEGEKAAESPTAAEQQPESIDGAAIRLPDGRVFSGDTHADAMTKAGIDVEATAKQEDELQKQGINTDDASPKFQKSLGLPVFDDGFVTSKGRFVDRDEAAAIAKANPSGQPPAQPENADVMANRRRGFVNTGAVTDSLGQFVKEDIAPKAIEAARAIIDAKNDIQSTLAPQTKDDQGRLAANMTRESAATRAQRFDRADTALSTARKFFDKQAPADNLKFIDAMENGKSTGSPATDAIAKTIRDMFTQRVSEVRSLGKGALENIIENYFPHIWKDPDKAQNVLGQMMGKRPLEGGKSFLKQRTIPTTADGIAKGLEPISTNPVDLTLLKIGEMDRYILAHKLMGDLKDRDLAKYIPAGQQAPDGYAKINDKIATVLGPKFGAVELPPSAGGRQLIDPNQVKVFGRRVMGEYQAPGAVANVLNNYLSPGLRGKAWYRGLMYASNTLNSAQLGVSAFHLGFTSVDTATSQFALGLKQAIRGEAVSGLKTAATSPAAPFRNFMLGNKVLKEWYKPGSQGGDIAQMVDAVRRAGGRARTDAQYRTDALNNMARAFRQGNVLGGLLRIPPAVFDAAAKPILETIVPRQKLGVFASMAKDEIDRLGPSAKPDDVQNALARAWDSADNRLGQVVYDNLFWNKAAKDLAMASTRSLGWNLGTWRELGGGVYDTVKNGAAILRGRTPEMTHRMAYTLALPILTGIIGGTMNYAMSGEPPKELKDFYFPRTGGMDEHGQPARVSIPSYMKDVFGAFDHPVKMLTDKLSPLLSSVADMLENKDYYGTEIRHPGDSFSKQAMSTLEFAAKQLKPFAIEGYQQAGQRGESFGKRAASFVGVTPAPAYVNESKAVKLGYSLLDAQRGSGARSQQDADRADLKGQLISAARRGVDVSGKVDQAIQDGKLYDIDRKAIAKKATQPEIVSIVEHMGPDAAMQVWNAATPEEKKDMSDEMRDKIIRSKVPPDQQDQMLKDTGIPKPPDLEFNREYSAMEKQSRSHGLPISEVSKFGRMKLGRQLIAKDNHDANSGKITRDEADQKIQDAVSRYGS